MISSNRLESLKTKHTHLEKELEKENSYSSCDNAKISALKRAKLKIKEEIQRFYSMEAA